MNHPEHAKQDPWRGLTQFTRARIALGRTGVSVPTAQNLAFRMAHAFARDAVYARMDTAQLQQGLNNMNITALSMYSQARDRQEYLQRPDAGRKLDPYAVSRAELPGNYPLCDIGITICDGLSATAVNNHALPLLQQLMPLLIPAGFSMAPVVIVENGRVAIGDETGSLLNAKLSLVLIGERPGLSSPDSLGVYLTFHPSPGNTDAMRNCISNIHAQGLGYEAAAGKIAYLVRESLQRKTSGIALKDVSEVLSLGDGGLL